VPELRVNRAKQNLQNGEVVTMLMGGPHPPDMIDLMGQFGFDSILIEGEHGPVDYGNIPDLTRACDIWGMTSVVRVGANRPEVIYRTFDLGAQGIMVPHINTREDGLAVVDACKFAPIGNRGMGAGRQAFGVTDYFKKANDETLVTVLIEDIAAMDHLDKLTSVDHIDVFYVAPGDFAQSMGLIGQTTHPDVLKVIDEAIAKIVANGKIAGALVNDGTANDYIAKGARFLGIPWTPWVANGARNFLNNLGAP